MCINQILMVIQELNPAPVFFPGINQVPIFVLHKHIRYTPNDSNGEEVCPRQLGKQFTLGHKIAKAIFSLNRGACKVKLPATA